MKMEALDVKEEEMETITLSDLIREAEEASLEEISGSRTVELPKLENTLSEAIAGVYEFLNK